VISFLQPLALFALAAASLPTLLHLLGRRLPPIVVFPAVRYLTATEQEHSRRLKLRNLVLLILRTLVIILIVLAAAHPVARVGAGGAHPPTAVALVVDNSLSSGAVVAGARTLTGLLDAAKAVLGRLGAGDRLWLTTADGLPRQLTRMEAEQVLDGLRPAPYRLDLGVAVRAAARVVSDDPLPWKEIVLLSDLQSTAVSPGEPVELSLIALEAQEPPPNRWVDSTLVQPSIWSPSGTVVARVAGSRNAPTPVKLMIGNHSVAQAVASPGDQVLLSGTLQHGGWEVATVELDPDEFRADDRRYVALQSADPARIAAGQGAGEFLVQALEVLRQGGRVREGDDVILDDQIGPGVRVVFPPADGLLVGALNRALSAQGAGCWFGDLERGEWEISGPVGPATGTTVRRRYSISGGGAVIARVGGSPWLVRQDRIVLVGSRMEPDWTDLPVTAGFIPFVDLLVNRVAAGESWILSAAPGDAIELPSGVTALLGPGSPTPVSAGVMTAPLVPGVYFLLGAATDTVGALQVNYDARESRLDVVDVPTLRSYLGDVRVVSRRNLDREIFREAKRADLTGSMLAAALICVLGEFAVASWLGTARRSN